MTIELTDEERLALDRFAHGFRTWRKELAYRMGLGVPGAVSQSLRSAFQKLGPSGLNKYKPGGWPRKALETVGATPYGPESEELQYPETPQQPAHSVWQSKLLELAKANDEAVDAFLRAARRFVDAPLMIFHVEQWESLKTLRARERTTGEALLAHLLEKP